MAGIALAGWLGLGPAILAADDEPAARVVVVANARQPASVALAEFYADARSVPRENILALPMPEDESISWREFVDHVQRPLQDELVRRRWIDAAPSDLFDAFGRRRATIHGHRIAFLVVCRGVPLRIHHDPTVPEPSVRLPGEPFATNQAAVDAELALLAQANPAALGFVPNPLFARPRPTAVEASQVVRVCRLDGPEWEDAKGLVRAALAAEREGIAGRYYLDRGGPHPDGDRWIDAVQAHLEGLGFDGEVEHTAGTFGAAARFDAPLWYVGWYASHVEGPFVREGFRFPPGAVAVHIHSFSAASLRSRTSGWTGPLVGRGVTATVGNVFEPYLQLTHRPDILVRALADGRMFGEAAYEALPVLGWQAVAVGDPLYRPFGPQAAGPAGSDSPYAVIRQARLLEKQGDRAAAIAVLEKALDRGASLPLILALSRQHDLAGETPRAVATLELARSISEYRGEHWALGREIARRLSEEGSPLAALEVYRAVADSPAPTPEAERALLEEAAEWAGKFGQASVAREFTRRLDEASAR